MYIYLSKKIAIPNNVRLHCCAWNSAQGYIACGGQKGLLKVLRLESADADGNNPRGIAAPSNLTMNQSLEGHHQGVICATWNANYRKLTTSDESGMIIVWVMHRGAWYEEMINNRNKSVVRDMKWTSDGKKICIVYEDGAVIVGSVDGNRLWGKEMKSQLSFVEWAPDGNIILFVTKEGEIAVHDAQGNRIGSVALYALENVRVSGYDNRIVGLAWYDGAEGQISQDAPTLAVAFRDGKVQITRGRFDENAVLIDTEMELFQCRWNMNGSVLALGGSMMESKGGSEEIAFNVVQFYDPFGRHLRSLRVPGTHLEALSWDGTGLRICLAVDSHIYFANIRPSYTWGYYSNTLVYSYSRADQTENALVFWDLKSDERFTKYVSNLQKIRASGENCVYVIKSEESDAQDNYSAPKEHVSSLVLCDTIGSPVETRYIHFEPLFLAMTARHIVAASLDVIYVWQYRNASSKLTKSNTSDSSLSFTQLLSQGVGREKIFYIDDTQAHDIEQFQYIQRQLNDPICAICASENWIMAARSSGIIFCFTLPHISLEMKYVVSCRPQLLSLNSDSSRLSIVDINGVMTLMKVGAPGNLSAVQASMEEFEKKDVWDVLWAEDNPELFAVMEKARMHFFRGLEHEDPVPSSGYLCQYKNLQVRAAFLDDILCNPEQADRSMVTNFETRSLRYTRDLLDNVGLQEACDYIQNNSHPHLYALLAEAALENLDFSMAERGFIKSLDYLGVQYVKRLHRLNDKQKQKAEVAAYFQQFDQAEAMYRKMDRQDLAIALRQRLGDYFRVVQLAQSGHGEDTLLLQAYDSIGEFYFDRHEWEKAIQYYTLANNTKALVQCYYRTGNFNQLQALAQELPLEPALLREMAIRFTRNGLYQSAVDMYLRLDDVKSAIDACVLLNEWEKAMALVEQYNVSQIENVLTQYASHLISNNKLLPAIELYRRANKPVEAATLLGTLAQQSKQNPLRAKKLYVLAALEVEQMRKNMLDSQAPTQTLDSLVHYDSVTRENRVLDNPWRGAEAYHFYLLVHRQILDNDMESAFATSIKLIPFEDLLQEQNVYSLIAFTALCLKQYEDCSKAFVKLEHNSSISKSIAEDIRNLALDIFTMYPPENSRHGEKECSFCRAVLKEYASRCSQCNRTFPVCMITGAFIMEQKAIACTVCRHYSLERHARHRQSCALCHALY